MNKDAKFNMTYYQFVYPELPVIQQEDKQLKSEDFQAYQGQGGMQINIQQDGKGDSEFQTLNNTVNTQDGGKNINVDINIQYNNNNYNQNTGADQQYYEYPSEQQPLGSEQVKINQLPLLRQSLEQETLQIKKPHGEYVKPQ